MGDYEAFLLIKDDPAIRPDLLALLQEQGLLSSFLQAESSTIPEEDLSHWEYLKDH